MTSSCKGRPARRGLGGLVALRTGGFLAVPIACRLHSAPIGTATVVFARIGTMLEPIGRSRLRA